MAGLLFKVIAVFISHCIVGFLFYRGRVVQKLPIFDSDLIVFAAPSLAAFFAYFWILFRSSYFPKQMWPRIGAIALICLLVTFLSHWASMILAFNTYGT